MKCDKLLDLALRSPRSLRFDDLTTLAECYGFAFARQTGSHHLYKRAGYQRVLNFQDDNGKAKPYQVRQLLEALRELRLIPE